MKKNFFVTLLLLLFTSLSLLTAQNNAITMKKVFGGYQFRQYDKLLNMNSLAKALEPNEQAYSQFKKGRANYTLASIIGGVGGGLVGYPIGTAIGGGDPNWTLAAIGAALIVVSIPISSKCNRQLGEAVNTFNNDLHGFNFLRDAQFNLALKPNGLGIQMRF